VTDVSDPPEFDRSQVPNGPLSDLFYSGKDGRGLTNEEWDEQRRRMREHGVDPFAEAAQ
jgi:hypothetical protein